MLGPDWAAALVLFESYASEDGDPGRARVVYERRLSGSPLCAFVERWMGDVCLYRLGVIHRARPHYQAATAAAPDHAPAHFQLGQVYFLLGVFDRARASWQVILDERRCILTSKRGHTVERLHQSTDLDRSVRRPSPRWS